MPLCPHQLISYNNSDNSRHVQWDEEEEEEEEEYDYYGYGQNSNSERIQEET